MDKDLIVVESPSKARTINKYLGKSYIVEASNGHIKDLPKSKMGVDIENDFKPDYTIIRGKKKIIDKLKRKAKKSDKIFLATDPDREGEAISYHLYQELSKVNNNIKRVLMNEITKRGVEKSFKEPTEIDIKKVDSQVARRVLDRLVGYKLSPLLWKKVKGGLSAGRVQSIALKLICDREREIRKFKEKEYWVIQLKLSKTEDKKKTFLSKLEKKKTKKFIVPNEETAKKVEEQIKKSDIFVDSVKKRKTRKSPPPPFITSTLQQNAYRVNNFPVKKTMRVAQKLYEGIKLGEKGLTGLITYMRTDSYRVSNVANKELRNFIEKKFGNKYISKKTRYYKKGKAQDAHEAIRPTDINLTPEKIKSYLNTDEYKLYKLIWERFLLTQMASARINKTMVWIKADDYYFRSYGQIIEFDGFLKVSGIMSEKELPDLKEREKLELHKIDKEQNFTKPPKRYTEGTLVKALENKNIGRPSTYSSIISTLQNRVYVFRNKKKFYPTELGMFVEELLENNFSMLMDYKFTARMEEELDKISEGSMLWVDSIKSFYKILEKKIEDAYKNVKYVRNTGIKTEKECPKCKTKMYLKNGKYGDYYYCPNEDCDYTEKYVPIYARTNEKCPKCGSELIWKKGKYGSFIACSNYPKCTYIKKNAEKTKYPCPNCKDGVLVKRKAKRKRIFFYGCSNYPKCKFLTFGKPIDQKCPKCGFKYMIQTKNKIFCPVCSKKDKNEK